MVMFVHAVVSRARFTKRTHTKAPDVTALEEGIVDDRLGGASQHAPAHSNV